MAAEMEGQGSSGSWS